MVARVLSIARGQFYYGWMIVGVGFASNFMTQSLHSYIFGVFFKPMSEEFGWTRAMYAGVQSVGTIVSGLAAPFVGPVIDRRGARGVMIFGAVLAGGGFAALSLVRGLWDFYLIRSILTVGIACAGSLTINVAVCNWFIRKRGKAVAAAIMGSSFGGIVMTPVATYLILAYGWRMAWALLGIAVWVVVILPVALFMKRRPEDVGLLPDGDRVESRVRLRRTRVENAVVSQTGIDTPRSGPPEADSRNPGGRPAIRLRRTTPGKQNDYDETQVSTPDSRLSTLPAEVTWTRSEAMRTSALWLTILAFGLGTLGAGAVTVHLIPLLTDNGITEAAAAAALSVAGIAAFSCKPFWGILIDKYQVRPCGIAFFAFGGIAWATIAVLSEWTPIWLVYVGASFAGLAWGGNTIIHEVLWAFYFGRLSLGSIRTVAIPFSVVFGAGSPFFAGWVYDSRHSYQLAFAVFSVASVAASALLYVGRPPQKAPKAIVDHLR